MKKQLLIAGGSGLIGSAIKDEALKRDWEVVILSRREGPGIIAWDPQKETISLSESRSFDAIINLAGTSIAGRRWTNARKKEILDSRKLAARTLEKYLHQGLLKTQAYIGASAIGIYSDRGNEILDETSPIKSGGDWMVRTVEEWEAGHRKMETLGIRTVICRIGIVLSLKGGALPEMLQTAAFGVLGYFGSGRQIWPWIHIDDLVGIMLHAVEAEKMNGIYLAVAPSPLSNKEIVSAVNQEYSPHRLVMTVPVFVLKVMLGEMHRMLMVSCNAYPKRLMQENFRFRFGTIKEAIENLLGKK